MLDENSDSKGRMRMNMMNLPGRSRMMDDVEMMSAQLAPGGGGS